jgi:hypothetical protein
MPGSEEAQRAGRKAADAATRLHAALFPGDELRGPIAELPNETQEDLNSAILELTHAEDALAPGIGKPDVAAGSRHLRAARKNLQPWASGLPFMRAALRNEIVRVLGTIDEAERLVA